MSFLKNININILLSATGLLLSESTNAQRTSLPVFQANGGGGKQVVYRQVSQSERDTMIGYVWSACSNCISTDCAISASSTLMPQGNANYKPGNMQDDDPMTAWVEGASDYGVGQYIETKASVFYNTLKICNGYQKSPKHFIENSRVKSFMLSENGVARCIINLKDEMGVQTVLLNKLVMKSNQPTLRFTILEVYPGTKFKDVAISELFASACCVAGNVSLDLADGLKKQISELSQGDTIQLLDRNNKVVLAKVLEIDKVVHQNFVEIQTEQNAGIVVTFNHWIYSGADLRKVQAGDLTTQDSLCIIDPNGHIHLDKITRINQMNQPTEAYYFKKLEILDKNAHWPLKAVFNNILSGDEYLDRLNQHTIQAQ
jgi:hypothetical protein